MTLETRRAVDVPGVRNVRDLGGLAGGRGVVRRGLVFRSAKLTGLTADGASRLSDLGLRTVLDLRADDERAQEPNAVPAHPQLAEVSQVVLPPLADLSGLPPSMAEIYIALVEQGAGAFVASLETLAEPHALPAFVHCSAGKDRTGLLVALLLRILDIDDAVIAADYMLSNEALGDALRRRADDDVLRLTLAHLDERYGGVLGYLEAHGLADETVDRLRGTLLS